MLVFHLLKSSYRQLADPQKGFAILVVLAAGHVCLSRISFPLPLAPSLTSRTRRAMEWAQYNIRVNSVSPGLVKTAMTYWVPQQPDWEQQLKYYGGIPRLAEVEELGGAYVYLLSDAASYTTSIDIPVNGVIGSEFSFSVLFVFLFL